MQKQPQEIRTIKLESGATVVLHGTANERLVKKGLVNMFTNSEVFSLQEPAKEKERACIPA